MERLERGHFQGVDLLGYAHGSDFGSNSCPQTPRQNQRRDNRPDLFQNRQRKHVRQHCLSAEADHRTSALHGQDDAYGQAGYADQDKALGPHFVHLPEQFSNLVWASPYAPEETKRELCQFADLPEKSGYHARAERFRGRFVKWHTDVPFLANRGV